MARQTQLVICAWHEKFFPEEVPVGQVLVFRRNSRRKKRSRFIVIPDNTKVKQRAMSHGICLPCSKRFMHDNINEFRENEIREMARCIKRR